MRRRAVSSLVAVVVVLASAAATLTHPQSAQATTCSAAAVTITPLQSPDGTPRPFYTDFSHGSTNHSGYVGYDLNGAGLGSDVWIKLSGFTSAIGLAANQSASIPVRATSQSGRPLVYAYLTASAATAAAQSFNVEVWNGKPNQAGSTQVCVGSDGFSSVEDIINANANKVTSISISNSSPAIGGSFDVTAVGDTGTMGAGLASDKSGGNGVISMAPAMDDSWPADAFSLTGTQITIGGTTTRDKLRIYPPGSAQGAYTAKYFFTVRNTTSGATTVLPVQSIASGTQVKYTGSYPATVSQISAPTVTTSLVKTATSMTGPPYHVTYQVVASNSSTSSVVLDYLRDTPTSTLSWTFDSGSAKLDGSTIADPTYDAAAGTLLFGGPFTIPARSGSTNGTLTFTYSLSIATQVSNSAVGTVGGVTLGAASGSGNQVSVDPTSPIVTTASLPNATASSSYSQTLAAGSGTPPYTWSVTSGALPAGLSLNSSSGVISGTPSTAGSATFTVTATDVLARTGSKSLTLTVDAAAPAGDTTRPTGSVTANGGTSTTITSSVSLGLTASDDTGVVAYRIAQGSDCSGASWVAVTPTASLSTTASLTLTGGDGAKTICADYKDAAGNISTTATTSITLDTTRPAVTLATAASDPTNGSFSVTATFSESVTGFTSSDVTLGNGNLSGFSGSGASYSFTVTPPPDGAVTIDVAAAAAADAAGNASTVAARLTRTIDTVRPSLTLSAAVASPVSGAFTVDAVFSESVGGFAAADVSIGNGSVSGLSGSGAHYSFTVTPAANGSVTVDVGAGAASDAAGNTSTAAAQLVRTADVTRPSLTLATAAQNPTTGAFTVTATFSENVNGFDVADVGVGNGTASALSGSGASYSFTVTPTGDGTVTVDVAAGAATDAAGNASGAATQLSRTVDSTRPTVTLSAPSGGPVNGAFTVTATFSESVTGFTAGDISAGNAAVSSFAGSGNTYTFTVRPAGDRPVTVDVPAGAATDAAGNLSSAATQLTRTVDSTRPSLTLSTPAGPVNGAFTVTATFSESVAGFTSSDVDAANGTVSGFAGSGSSYTFTITPTGDGTVTVDVAANAATDAAGNANSAATELTRTADLTRPTVTLSAPAGPLNAPFQVTATFSESVTGFTASDLGVANGAASAFAGSGTTYTFTVTAVGDGSVTVDVPADAAHDDAGNGNATAAALTRTVDGATPTVALDSPAGPVTGAFTVTVTFSKSVSGFTSADATIGNGTLSGFAGSGRTYTFTVTPAHDGTVTVDVAAGVAADDAGNPNAAATRLTRVADVTRPTVTLSTQASSPVNGPFAVVATFSETVTGFTAADLATTRAKVSGVTGSGAVYTLTVSPTADGLVTLAVAASGASDAAGNGNIASAPLSVYSDVTPPTITFLARPASRTVETTAAVAFAAGEVATFECSLDGAPYAACASPMPLEGLGLGAHTYSVRARDLAGNVSTGTLTWTVVKPTVDFTTDDPIDVTDETPTIRWVGNDPNLLYTCTLDSQPPMPCSQPFTLTNLPDGDHTFTVVAALPDGAVKGSATQLWTTHRVIPKPDVVIVPKLSPTDLLGRPRLFKQSADAPHSNGPFTRKIEVTLEVPTPADVETVYISNHADFRDGRSFSRNATDAYDWTLLPGPSGDRTVYIRFADTADAPVGQATIVLDQELPPLAPRSFRTARAARVVQIATGRTVYCGAAPRRWLRTAATDGFSGLNAIQIASNPAHPCEWRPFLSVVSYRLPGKYVYVRVEDRVGNISRWHRVRQTPPR